MKAKRCFSFSFSFSFSFIFCIRSGIGGSDYKVLPQLCPLLTPPHSFTTQAVPTTAARRCGVGVELPHIISAFLCKTITHPSFIESSVVSAYKE